MTSIGEPKTVGEGEHQPASQTGHRGGHRPPQHQQERSMASSGREIRSGRGGARGGSGKGRRNFRDDPDVKLSKSLSWLLRHGAEKEGFKFDEGGYLNVEDILALQRFKVYTTEDIERIVANNEKKRFSLRNHPENNRLQICANQGHTINVEGLDLTPIADATQYPTVIHGTYLKAWEKIQKQGLSRMRRNHIHCAPGEPGEEGVVSGMRHSCQVIIYLDLEKALKDGLEFFISANNVILSSGNKDGIILPKYFKDVIQLRPRRRLPFEAS